MTTKERYMAKVVIKTHNGKFLKMAADVVEANEQHMAQRTFMRVGAEMKTTAYNYKTREQAERALAVINEYVKQNKRTEAEAKAVAGDWRYTKYVNAQVGCYIEELE
jgi:hypothetical protein